MGRGKEELTVVESVGTSPRSLNEPSKLPNPRVGQSRERERHRDEPIYHGQSTSFSIFR